MKLRIRRILYTFFILSFFILAPLLIMYAIGYRFNFKNQQITKTGLLILETKPEKVNIYIDDKLKYLKAPINGENLQPGIYDIKITKPNYYSWQKKLKIKNKLTTFAQNIILFKKPLPVKIIDGNFDDFTLSPDKTKILTIWQDEVTAEIWSYDIEKNKNKLLHRKSLNNSKIKIKKWSRDNNSLLLNNVSHAKTKDGKDRKNINDFFIIKNNNNFWKNENDLQIINLKQLTNEPIIDTKWDSSESNIIYITTNNGLFSLNLNNNSIKKIISSKPTDFIVYDKIQYFNNALSCLIETNKNPISSKIVNKSDCSYTLPKNNFYKIFPSPRGLSTVLSLASENLTVIDLNNKNKIFQGKTNNIKWNVASNKMLYYNTIEVGTFSPSHENPYKNEIIGRYSTEIIKAKWHPSNHHIIILLDNSIKIIELDARDNRNVVEINDFYDLKNIYLDKKGKNLYVAGKKDNKSGIWQINIF